MAEVLTFLGVREMAMWPLNGTPLDVQVAALDKSGERRGFAYFKEMGLGKSATILAEFINLYDKGKVRGLIVVCPNSLKGNWRGQVNEWVKHDIEIAEWPNLPKAKGNDKPWAWFINYEAFTGGAARGVDLVGKALGAYPCMMVLDESINIKNYKSKRARELIVLGKSAKYARILSGAPMTQGPHDLWPQLRFISGISGINPIAWKHRYCITGGYKGKQVFGAKKENMEELQQILDSCSFTAKKRDWTDLPPKLYTTRDIRLNEEQLKAYREMFEYFAALVIDENGDEIEVETELVLTQMMKLQQISSGFIIDETGNPHLLGGTNHKINEIEEILQQTQQKIIIFAVFRASMQILYESLSNLGIITSVMVGGMSTEEIEKEKKRFNEGDSEVFLIQSQTGKYGHTLLGTEDKPCSTTIFYENDFNLDTRIQCEDRNHRTGQKGDNVLYIDFHSSPIEKAAISALQRKSNVAEAIIDGIREERR